MSDTNDQPLLFSDERKLRKQMRKRGWTDASVREALATLGIPTMGRHGSATRYAHPVTGASVSVDNRTGEIFHVVEPGFGYDQY